MNPTVWQKRDERTHDDGARELVLVGRHRFAASGPLSARSNVPPDAPNGASTEERAALGSSLVVEGIASSTSRDSYGTELSLGALEQIAQQAKAGLPLLPRHNNGLRAVEWDEVIGRTTGAVVEKADVVDPVDASEPGYTLTLTSELYSGEPLAQALVTRLNRKEPIGQSIGGWFLTVRVIERDGDVVRLIVEDVLLDHVAVTRSPANPDATGLVSLRSALAGCLPAARAATDEGDKGDESGESDEGDEGEACPIATYSPEVNLDNWAEAVSTANYGPEDVDAPGSFWKDRAERLQHTDSKQLNCANCAYFNVAPEMKSCIAAGIATNDALKIVDGAGLGFCDRGRFKCTRLRACDRWVAGGPVVGPLTDEQSTARRLREGKSRSVPADIHKDDYVWFLSTERVEKGRVEDRQTEGSIEDVPGTPEDPALRVRKFRQEGDGYVATDLAVAIRASQVERTEALIGPSSEWTYTSNFYQESTEGAAAALDVRSAAVHDTQESAAPAGDATTPGEAIMLPKDVEQLVERAVAAALAARGVAGLAAQDEAAAATPPAPPAPDEAAQLRAENARLRSLVTNMAATPVRRGLAYQPSEVGGQTLHGRTVLHDLVERSRAGFPAIAQTIEAQLGLITGEKAERASVSELHAALASALRSAEAEGLLGNPSAQWA